MVELRLQIKPVRQRRQSLTFISAGRGLPGLGRTEKVRLWGRSCGRDRLRDLPELGASSREFLSFLKQGEWVWLKKFEAGTAPELRPSCLSLLRKVGLPRGCETPLVGIGPYLVPTQWGSV